MSLLVILTLVVGGLTLASAVVVILSKNPLFAIVYLFLACMGVACELLLLGAFSLGVLHWAVSAASLMVLFMFLAMISKKRKDIHHLKTSVPVVVLSIMLGCVFLASSVSGLGGMSDPVATFSVEAMPTTPKGQQHVRQSKAGSLYQMGTALTGRHLLTFEMLGVLLLLSCVALVVFLRGGDRSSGGGL